MSSDFRVHITDPQRAAAFERALGTSTVYVKTPIPEKAILPGYPDGAPVFLLDLTAYSAEDIVRLADEIAGKWGLSRQSVLNDIYRDGIPILDEACTVIIHNPQRWVD